MHQHVKPRPGKGKEGTGAVGFFVFFKLNGGLSFSVFVKKSWLQ